MTEQQRQTWHIFFTALAAAASLCAVFYTVVIAPIQANQTKFDTRIDENERALAEIAKFEGGDLEWNIAHDQSLTQLRSDLASAYADREKKLDRLTARLDEIERRLQNDH